jgi:NMD protein affecting ribosome stability and mRNA decay
MTINTGWTPNPLKYCVRCGGVHEDQLYELCQVCRDGDKLAEELSPDIMVTCANCGKYHSVYVPCEKEI